MSMTADRAAIAAALSTVDGITGSAYRPTVLDQGAAWPLISRLTRGPARDYRVTWRVAVVLPADERRAADFFDAHVDALTDALDDVAWVSGIEPGAVATGGGDLPCMIITMDRES